MSFGVAPSMIVYQFLRLSLAKEQNAIDTPMLWLMPAFIIACAGAYRLARFNIDYSQSYGFKGVPIPAVGLLIASFPLIYWHSPSSLVIDVLLNKWVLYGVVLLVSWLMVSTMPIMALKFKNFSFKSNIPKIILLVTAIVAAIFLQWLAVPVVFIVYILLSLLYKK